VRYHVKLPVADQREGREIAVDVVHLPAGGIQVTVQGRTFNADVLGQGACTHLLLEGRSVDLWMEGAPPDVGVVANGGRFYARVESERMRDLTSAVKSRGSTGAGVVTSPMPGRVLKVLVQEGEAVIAGAPLLVVEAMKMENELSADRDGTVKRIYVTPGANVECGARLVEVG
jgi:biotin carboxyl carrier protein